MDQHDQNTYAYYTSSTTLTDALGRVTEYDWIEVQGLRRITRKIDPKGGITTYAYDTNLNLVSETDPLGHVTKAQYDASGNVTAASDPNGAATQAQYNAFSEPTSLIDAKGNQTLLTYDAVGNLVTSQDAKGAFTNYGYDKQGHVTAQKDSLGDVTSFAYDGNGALTSVADPLGRATSMSRDALSRVTSQSDPAGKQTLFSYDADGNVTQVKDALSGVTGYSYQPGRAGRLLALLTDADGHATAFAYDLLDRQTSVTNALHQAKNFTYDKKGNLATVTDAKNQTVTYAYDDLDRLITETRPEGQVKYEYDADGNLTKVANYNGSVVAMTYDALGRLTQEIQTLPSGFSATLGYAYDSNGNRTRMTTPWGSFTYAYDSLDRLTTLTNPQNETFTFSYDALGRRTKLTYPNGIVATYAYDAASQVTQILYRRASDNTAVAFENYTYDSRGNRVTAEDQDGTTVYGYDDLNRLVSATHPAASLLPVKNETFSYDAVGNRLSDASLTGYTYDSANELLENSGYKYGYDANGNLASKTDKATNQATSYSWDSGNRLVQVGLPDGVNVNFQYDALGRRVYKSSGTAASQTTQYVNDGQDFVATVDGAGALTALFTMAPSVGEPLEMHRADGTEFFLHGDAIGSVVAETDSAGAPVDWADYEAFGLPVFSSADTPPAISSASATGNPIAFGAMPFDAGVGLYFHRARYRDPLNGTFISVDPLGFRGGSIDLYSYVADRPTRDLDPDGTAVLTPPPGGPVWFPPPGNRGLKGPPSAFMCPATRPKKPKGHKCTRDSSKERDPSECCYYCESPASPGVGYWLCGGREDYGEVQDGIWQCLPNLDKFD